MASLPLAPGWDEALRQQEILLLDHRNLEYKAAQTALSLMGRYLTKAELTARCRVWPVRSWCTSSR